MPVIKKGQLPPPPEKQGGVRIRKGELAPPPERASGYAPEPDPEAAQRKFAPRTVKP